MQIPSAVVETRLAASRSHAETRPASSLQPILFLEGSKPNLKWAASQEAVTLPWLSAHSIRTRIGGDSYMLNPPARLSRINFPPSTWFHLDRIPAKRAGSGLL